MYMSIHGGFAASRAEGAVLKIALHAVMFNTVKTSIQHDMRY